MWEVLLKPGGSCGIQEMGCGVRGTGVHLRIYYKLTGGGGGEVGNFFTFSRDAATKKNVLGAWEASLK